MKTSTRYQKSIKSPLLAKNVLKTGSNNKKLGFKVTAKKWKGKRLYSLTLVERETCDTSCHHWEDCYGNNMPFAHRFETEGLIPKLREEIKMLLERHKEGVVIRLHVLGDFYSVEYIQFWNKLLWDNPNLCIFGYTGIPIYSQLASYINNMNQSNPTTCLIRYSRNREFEGGEPFLQERFFAADESFEGKGFTCPEQTGKVKNCASCGLCWTVTKTVKFLTH